MQVLALLVHVIVIERAFARIFVKERKIPIVIDVVRYAVERPLTVTGNQLMWPENPTGVGAPEQTRLLTDAFAG